jgi:hypothetical protein
MLAHSSSRLALAVLAPLLLGLIGCAPVYRLGQRPAPTPRQTPPLKHLFPPPLPPAQSGQQVAPRQPAA